MPEHLKALIVILVLAGTVFAFAKKPVCAMASSTADFNRRRNLWFGVTLAAFLAHNFWLFIILTALLLMFAMPREPNKLAMYFFLLFAVPIIGKQISGLLIFNHLFEINYVRLLSLVILLPTFLSLRKQVHIDPFGRLLPDKLLAGYIVLNALLMMQATTLTETMRSGIFYPFIDIFLPYYVASRLLKNIAGFREALAAFVVATLILGLIGVFEFVRHWLLYISLDTVYYINRTITSYLVRGEALRALGSTGHSIVLGYVMAVGLGFFIYLRKSIPNPLAWLLGLALLIAGLISALSRGPWVGATAMMLVYLATGSSPGKSFVKVGMLGLILAPLLLALPIGRKIIDFLPFIGNVDAENVTYRQRLLQTSIEVILQNPFFGSNNFYSQMEALRQGQGIIDLVNTYLGIALLNGLVGLSLFASVFVVVTLGIYGGMRKLTDRNDEHYLLGQALLSVLLGIIIIIFAASSISFIPVIYWSVVGLGVAYMRMLALAKAPSRAAEVPKAFPFRPRTTRQQ